MSKKNQTVIVVRRNKKHKHAHHGGSWKIAYADFMTAMMAFFLVMWLLSNSTPQQLEQIAEYFKMPLKVALSGGNKSSLSESIIPGGGDDVIKQDGEVFKKTLKELDKKKNETNLKNTREKIQSLIESDPRLSDFKSNLLISLTDDGLLIQIVDSQERPMFKVGSKVLEPYMRDILQALAPVLNGLPNRISLTGHTDSLPYAGGDQGYGNWELSSDRANASRSALVSSGLASNKVLRVIGTADAMSMANSKADDPINRRISILVLSKQKEKEILKEDTILQNISTTQGGGEQRLNLEITPTSNYPVDEPVDSVNTIKEKVEQNGRK
ncbi:MAG: flagellar motor protein MotB [Kluyvera sp.]